MAQRCDCPDQCQYHRTGQYDYYTQMARMQAIGISLYEFLTSLEGRIQAGEIARQGLTVIERGRIFHI